MTGAQIECKLQEDLMIISMSEICSIRLAIGLSYNSLTYFETSPRQNECCV